MPVPAIPPTSERGRHRVNTERVLCAAAHTVAVGRMSSVVRHTVPGRGTYDLRRPGTHCTVTPTTE